MTMWCYGMKPASTYKLNSPSSPAFAGADSTLFLLKVKIGGEGAKKDAI
jgi:hypothetical protein